MPNFRNFKISSEQPTDIVVLFLEGQAVFEYNSYSIPHNLGFAPLVFGFWSETEDFTSPIPFTMSAGINYFDPVTQEYKPIWDSVQASASTTGITLYATQATSHPVYYRIYAFMPTDLDLDAGTTSQHAQRFIINSDYNYRKVFMAGDVILERDTSVQPIVIKPITINHNLGYKPQVMVWVGQSTGIIQELQASQFANTQLRVRKQAVEVNEQSVIITAPFPQGVGDYKAYYRIYYDEAE